MAQYYFLTTMLPQVSLQEPPRLSFEELIPLYLQNLTPADYEQFRRLRLWIDVQNMRLFWLGLELDPRGNWLKKALETQLLTGEQLPESVVGYLGRYESDEARLAHYAELYSAFLNEQIATSDGFLHDYLELERGLMLVAAAIRAKRLGRDLAKELASQDANDPLVAWLLSFRDASHVEAPIEFQRFAQILETHGEAPMELRRLLIQYRLDWITERTQDDPFSIDWLLGYAVQLLLVEQWFELDAAAGEMMIDAMVAS
jgi:hypothetical protein